MTEGVMFRVAVLFMYVWSVSCDLDGTLTTLDAYNPDLARSPSYSTLGSGGISGVGTCPNTFPNVFNSNLQCSATPIVSAALGSLTYYTNVLGGLIGAGCGSQSQISGCFVTTPCATSNYVIYDTAALNGCKCPGGDEPIGEGVLVQTSGAVTCSLSELLSVTSVFKICILCLAGPGSCPSGIFNAAGVCADPHFVGFDGSSFDVQGKDGYYYSLLSESQHAFNARFGNVGTVRVASLWMTELGLVYKDFNLTVKLALDFYQPKLNSSVSGGNVINRMLYDRLEDVVQVSVNGEDVTQLLQSDGSSRASDVLVYYPKARHQGDATDGPLLVVRTPDMEATILLETEGVVHLDFTVQVLGGSSMHMHGLVGQTWQWSRDLGNNVVEGAEDDYILPSLLDTQFKYSVFGKPRDGARGRSALTADALRATSNMWQVTV